MDSAVSHVKTAQTFQKAVELEQVLEHKPELVAALAELSRSQESALGCALNQAVQRGLLQVTGGEARYGVIVVRHDAKAGVLVAACEQILAGTGIVVHATSAQCEPCSALNLMRRAPGSGLLITSHEKLLRLDHDTRSSRLERPAEGVPWSVFSLLIEYDALPEPLAMQARLDPRLSIVVLAPHVQSASGSAAAAAEAGRDKHAGQDRQAQPQPSPLDSFILSLRQTHGASHDAAIETSSLLGSRAPALRRAGAHAASDTPRSVLMVGEDLLLHGRRLVGILRRQGVELIETSMELPHLILDHETGVLACDEAMLRQPEEVAQMVRRCEISCRRVWLLLLHRSSGGAAMRELWASARAIAAATSASPLQLTIRLVPWQCVWDFLRPLIVPPSGVEGSTPEEDAQEETQHEALLVRCSLNACAARRVVRGHSLQDVLSLQPKMRLAHLSWIPERAAAGFKGAALLLSAYGRGSNLLPRQACLRPAQSVGVCLHILEDNLVASCAASKPQPLATKMRKAAPLSPLGAVLLLGKVAEPDSENLTGG